MGAGSGNTSAIVFGGSPAIADTESWDGTSWTELNNMNTGRNQFGPAGTATSALAFGGGPSVPSNGNLTEEWSESPSPTTKTITVS